MAVSAQGEFYIADGTNIRYVDTAGIIHTLVGDHYHNSNWKPFPCSRTPPISQVHLRWPTELTINPLDGTLHILDDHLVLKITHDRRIKIVAGKPVQCSLPKSTDKSNKATEEFLESPQSIAFASNGDLYIAESDSQMINRIRVVFSNGKIARYVGADLKCSCMDASCRCIDEDHYLAVTSKLNTISSIAVTHDDVLHICDQGNLRIRSVKSLLPSANDFNEYEIHLPETQEIYIFNRHGHHIATKNILTGKTVYTFSYNVNTSFGKLSTVTDAAGNKLYILRDYNNQVNTIENTQGGKCRLEMSRMRMLQSFTTPDNFKTTFEYHGSNGLLRSKSAGTPGQSHLYSYDNYGRLVNAITPSGQELRLTYSLNSRAATVEVQRDGRPFVSFFIRGPEVASRIGNTEERVIVSNDGGLSVLGRDSSVRDLETVPSPVLEEPTLAEIFPVPARVRTSLSEEVVQRLEWRYYLRREGKGRARRITQVGRKLKLPDTSEIWAEGGIKCQLIRSLDTNF
ncbi:TENM2 [Cordylochernes scorpioides]|uniref:TENM2 n=1 Tax=Cordylochernes scorpioides TaxID=51811 RepID=A0ABY6KSN7_9ARAC|nr:TENM2 [Cordylochernes scorpioides]